MDERQPAEGRGLGQLGKLGESLVGHLWPAERILAGMRVNKSFRLLLLHYADRVVLQPTFLSCQERHSGCIGCRCLRDLRVFRKQVVEIRGVRCRDLNRGFVLESQVEEEPENHHQIVAGVLMALEVGGCRGLHDLDLSSCIFSGLEDVVQVLRQCTKLRRLNLGGFCFGSDDAHLLATALRFGSHLSTLCLDGCSLKVPDIQVLAEGLMHCSKLADLNLASNEIAGREGARAIATILRHCTAVSRLDISRNVQLKDAGLAVLAEALPMCTSLKALNVGWVSMGPAGAERLAAALGRCTALTELRLSGGSIANRGVSALGDALEHCTQLAVLDLACCELRGRGEALGHDMGLAALAKLVGARPALTSLDLWHPFADLHEYEKMVLAMGVATCHNLKHLRACNLALASPERSFGEAFRWLSALTSLDLARAGMRRSDVVALELASRSGSSLTHLRLHLEESRPRAGGAVVALGAILQRNTQLERLQLRECGLSDDAAPAEDAFFASLARCQKLLLLDLTECGIKAAGALGRAVTQLRALQQLDLSDNDTLQLAGGGEELVELGGLVGQCAALEAVELSRCALPPALTGRLLEALAAAPRLRKLGLSGALDGDREAEAERAMAALRLFSSLERLDLTCNCLRDPAAAALAAAASRMRRLGVLQLSDNRIGDAGATALGAGLAKLQSLRRVEMDDNEVEEAGVDILEVALGE